MVLADTGIPVGGTKGASVHVGELARAFAAQGAEVLIVAERAAGPPPPGIRLHLADPGPVPKGPAGELRRVAAGERLLAEAAPLLAKFEPNIVYERLSLFFGGTADLAAQLGAARLVEVNAPIDEERARHFGLEHRDLADRLLRQALDGATAVAVSEALVGWTEARGAARVLVVANGADPARFDPSRHIDCAGRLRRAWGLQGSEVVGFAGSLKPWHGVETLIDAVEALGDARPGLRLVVVGDGPCRQQLEDRALGRGVGARFLGAVSYEVMACHLAAFDVVAAPYRAEPGFYFCPLKVLEAMAAARAVVASDVGAVGELLGGTGSVVAPGDPAALGDAIGALLSDPGRRLALGSAARERAASEHSWEAVARRLLDLGGVPSLGRKEP